MNTDGLPMFPKPDREPYYPENILQTESDELVELSTTYTLWKNYAGQETARAEAELSEKKERLNYEEAKAMVRVSNDESLYSKYKAKEDRIAYVNQLDAIADLRGEIAVLS